jgi:hypothetical protein
MYPIRECITFCSIVWQLAKVHVNSCETYIHISRVTRINLLHIKLFIGNVFFIINLWMKILRIESYLIIGEKVLSSLIPFYWEQCFATSLAFVYVNLTIGFLFNLVNRLLLHYTPYQRLRN